MDFNQTATALIEKHERKTQHLSPLVRAAARAHYRQGLEDTFRSLSEEALLEERLSQPASQPASLPANPLTGPLAVQPTHAAEES